jgi:hypothetical protein
MAIRRAVFTALPPKGDYVLSPTGYSWNVRRSNGDGGFQSIFAGERVRSFALSHLVSLADSSGTDAWETAGSGSFWLIARFRRCLADRSAGVEWPTPGR